MCGHIFVIKSSHGVLIRDKADNGYSMLASSIVSFLAAVAYMHRYSDILDSGKFHNSQC